MPYLNPETKAARERLRMEFASRLKQAMDAAALTQAELSQISGVPQPSLSGMMKGRLGPSKPRLVALAKALRMEPHELMPEPDSDDPLPPPIAPPGVVPPGAGDRVVPEGPRTGAPWIIRSISDNRATISGSLVQYIKRMRRTITVEMAEMLAEVQMLNFDGVPKDEGFWERRREEFQKELDRRDEEGAEIAREAEASEAPVAGEVSKEVGGSGRPRPGRGEVRKRAARS
jgi:predicted XRE-type DNA-binding protein